MYCSTASCTAAGDSKCGFFTLKVEPFWNIKMFQITAILLMVRKSGEPVEVGTLSFSHYLQCFSTIPDGHLVDFWTIKRSNKNTKGSPPFSDAKKPSLWRNASTLLRNVTSGKRNESKPKSKHIGHGVIHLAQKGKKKGGTFLLSVSWEKTAKKKSFPPPKKKKIGIQPKVHAFFSSKICRGSQGPFPPLPNFVPWWKDHRDPTSNSRRKNGSELHTTERLEKLRLRTH